MLRALYIVLALLVIGGYAYSAYRGLELSTAERGRQPEGLRGRAGVAPVFWYGGYRGGK